MNGRGIAHRTKSMLFIKLNEGRAQQTSYTMALWNSPLYSYLHWGLDSFVKNTTDSSYYLQYRSLYLNNCSWREKEETLLNLYDT